MAKIKATKEVRRNIPIIDNILLAVRLVVTVIVGAAMTFLCTWLSYVVQSEEEFYTIESMKLFLDGNNFMFSYMVCGAIFWCVIGFILATLIVKAIKYFLNYK
jgi:hypothetical protein